jgi:hypothetical protein
LNANWTAADSAIHTLASGYLPISGGTITGSLGVTGNMSVTGGLTAAAISSTGAISAGAAIVATGQVSGASVNSTSGLFYVGGSSNYYVGRGSDSTWRFVENGKGNLTLDASGNLAVAARVTCGDIMNSSGAFYVQGSSTSFFFRSTVDGAWRWVDSSLTNLTLDAAGNLTARGAVHGSNVTALEARIEELTARVADLEALRLG